ncbi:hypothetical protein RRG08_016407 [Elysia crispata]|uniref:Uncharacterized protein n=1 Tax=Elysia crispata TaxID=231223 RepID=A0AAE0Y978_9GAST|nr:hypothetical protein RRG08_016407 [Elysia crispata]
MPTEERFPSKLSNCTGSIVGIAETSGQVYLHYKHRQNSRPHQEVSVKSAVNLRCYRRIANGEMWTSTKLPLSFLKAVSCIVLTRLYPLIYRETISVKFIRGAELRMPSTKYLNLFKTPAEHSWAVVYSYPQLTPHFKHGAHQTISPSWV